MFNEQSLYDAIVSTWGEHGAHADVFRELLKKADSVASKNTVQQQGKVMKHELVAVHANGEGWGLQVEVDGNSVAEIPWPKGWPIFVDGGWMREHGFRVVHA